MAKGRRDQFEDQLRDLQKDISNLSQKLSIPSIVASSRYAGRDDTRTEAMESSQDIHRSFNNGSARSHAPTDKGEKYAQLMQEAHVAKKEKDDAIYRLEQAKLEIEDMRKSLQDTVRLKTAYEHLKQDYESVKVSLESSERIRKQQKELINLLQRSHSIAVASDSGSIMSLGSISSIEHVGSGGNQPSSANRKALDLSSASLAAENREWLYKSMDLATNGSSSKASSLPHTVGESTIGAGAGAGAGHSSRSSRRRSVSGLPPRPSPSMSTNPGYVGYTTRAQTPANDDFAVSKSAPNSANNSTNNSTTTGASSTKGGRKTPKHPGTKSRRKSTKSNTPNIIPTHLLGNLTEGVPSYQNIINMNTSLVPNSSNSQTDGNNNRSFGNAGFTGTDVGAYSIPVRNPIDLNSSHLSHGSQPSSRYSQAGDFAPSMSSPGLSTLPADPPAGASASHYPQQHQQYSVPSSAQPFRRPPRHPVGTVPSSTSSTRRVTATIPSVHPTAYADPNGYVPPAGYSLVPDAPSSGTPRRPSTASNTGARATTASSRASASKASTSSSGRKSPGLIRRMPGSSNNYNNNNNNNSVASPHPSAVTAGVAPRTAKTRSHSAPPVRHVPVSASKPVGVSTFGNASRNL